MPLTAPEAQAAYDRLTARFDIVADALKPDDDGKVRLTKAEIKEITHGLLGDVIAFLVDVVD